jgi:hypothetical protein
LAERIGLVPLEHLGVDLGQPRLDARDLAAAHRQCFLGLDGHQLVRRRGDVRPQPRQPLVAPLGDQARFGGVAARRVDQLRALAHQQLARRQPH